jgi:hypothetical protein
MNVKAHDPGTSRATISVEPTDYLTGESRLTLDGAVGRRLPAREAKGHPLEGPSSG